MTMQREKQKHGEGDEGEEKIRITFRNADGLREEFKVKKGTRVKDFLAGLKHAYRKGLSYKLNNVLLHTNKDTGELLDDAVLEQEAVLVVEQQFTGGASVKK